MNKAEKLKVEELREQLAEMLYNWWLEHVRNTALSILAGKDLELHRILEGMWNCSALPYDKLPKKTKALYRERVDSILKILAEWGEDE